MPETAFTVADWIIVIGYMGVILGIGIFVNRYISRLDHYLVAGRSVGFGLAIATMIGTELGLVTIAYASQKGFLGGFAAIHIAIIQFTMCVLIGFTGFIIYRLRKLGVMTLPEYCERRFGRGARVLGGVICRCGSPHYPEKPDSLDFRWDSNSTRSADFDTIAVSDGKNVTPPD
jgi:SSS family solute:Na+ symporter